MVSLRPCSASRNFSNAFRVSYRFGSRNGELDDGIQECFVHQVKFKQELLAKECVVLHHQMLLELVRVLLGTGDNTPAEETYCGSRNYSTARVHVVVWLLVRFNLN